MKQVLKVSDLIQNEKKEKKNKNIEITHYSLLDGGWQKMNTVINETQTLVYLGNCSVDGDLFACYGSGTICICKGHLNDGTY